jgi:8-oxo-dGTP pyrophosphatase MutT (NUDIX family)
MSDLTKAHIKGYSKKDGTYVRPHERAGEPSHPNAIHHPNSDDEGDQVMIHEPHHSSAPSTWHNPDAVATFVPGGDIPRSINGVALREWKDHPTTAEGWDYVEGVNEELEEPAFILAPGKKASAGVVIEESDGRVWLTAPTNQFGGYRASFPKGTAEPDLSLQATAIKECFEETGLKVEIVGFLGDYERTTSVARMYRARRVGGDPTSMGWESQAVHLVPKGILYEHLNMDPDHNIAEHIGAGPAPTKDKINPPKAISQKRL